MIAGTTDKYGRTWRRCPECGDSERNRNKAHLMIDEKGSAYCFRCSYSTQLSIDDLIAIAFGDRSVDEALEAEPEERVPVHSGRFTLLDKYAIVGIPWTDSFQMRNCHGRVIGWHNRRTDIKYCTNEGQRGLGYVGDRLVLSPSEPLILVEGPYDVVRNRHVCGFGSISRSILRHLRLQYLWLWPDPDILATTAKRQRFVKMVHEAVADDMAFVLGVIVSNADPDEATQQEHVPYEDINKLSI